MKNVKHLKTSRKAYLIKKLPKIMESNTISTSIKNKEKYFKALEENCSSKKQKLRNSDLEKLSNVVFRWFLSKRSQNIPIDGNLIEERAITYVKKLGYNNFDGSARWLDR